MTKNNPLAKFTQHSFALKSSDLVNRGLVALKAKTRLQPAQQKYWLHFPEDRSIGHLMLAEPTAFNNFKWTYKIIYQIKAQGLIEVPSNFKVGLSIHAYQLPILDSIDHSMLLGLECSVYEDLDVLVRLADLTSLTCLSISTPLASNLNVTDSVLAHLASLSSLLALSLQSNEITDVGLAHLKKLTSLTELILVWCYQISDAGLVHLEKLKSFEKAWFRRLLSDNRRGFRASWKSHLEFQQVRDPARLFARARAFPGL